MNKLNIVAQNIARETMNELYKFIKPGISEKEIEDEACRIMEQKGSNSWWYHGVGALVLLGDRSIISTNGREYKASSDKLVAQNDVVTIDLAPTVDLHWGDYARTIFVENGAVVLNDADVKNPEYQNGFAAEIYLHNFLLKTAKEDMTYEDIFYLANAEIEKLGFINLDFRNNLGHSIEIDEKQRVYLEKDVKQTFKSVGKPFTFEPHIMVDGAKVGFKRENIYYFEDGVLLCL